MSSYRKLEFKDIAGYYPYGLCYTNFHHGSVFEIELYNCGMEKLMQNSNLYKLVLRPLSDLYRTIRHNGKEFIPILELIKIGVKGEMNWEVQSDRAVVGDGVFTFEYKEKENGFAYCNNHCGCKYLPLSNQAILFDLLNDWKIDYRGLIDGGWQ